MKERVLSLVPAGDGKVCIYCAGKRGRLAGNIEHIWPQSLGGDHGGDFFKTDQVCEKCNHDSGLWVDGGFIKSFFIQSERSFSEIDFLDPKSDLCVSLIYMGNDENFPCGEAEVCDRWIGPSGDHIYHVHKRDDPKWHAHAGGDIIARKSRDAGRVYVRLVDKGERRMLVSLRSIKKHFKKSRLIVLAEFADPNFEINAGLVSPVDRTTTENNETAWILERAQNESQGVRLQIDVDPPRRFLAKLALGFGSKILGDRFALSRDADALRSALWPNSKFGHEDEVRGSDFLGTRDDLVSRILCCPSAWSLYFTFDGGVLGLVVTTPKGQMAAIRIADLRDESHAELPAQLCEGHIYVIVPARKACFGPISAVDYVAHRLGHIPNQFLRTIEGWREETLNFLDPIDGAPKSQPLSTSETSAT